MTNPISLGNPFALGATGVLTTTRTDRIAMSASFRPGAAALATTSGFLVGPANTQGELTLVSDTVLRIAPFIAVIQGTHNSAQGQYVVPNGSQRDLAVVAKDASQTRKVLIVVRAADSLEAGVASSATTDGAWVELVSGALAASNPVLPATPANALAAGELTVPSTASGLPVTLSKYDPRTTVRGGVLPIVNDALTYPGHGSAVPVFDGEVRSHPTRGLQVSAGGVWGDPLNGWDSPIARGRNTDLQGIATATWTAMRLNVEDIDTHGMFAPSNTAMTIQKRGVYFVQAGWAANGTVTGRRIINVWKNGADAGVGRAAYFTNVSADLGAEASGVITCNVGDTLAAVMYQDSGVTINVSAATFSPAELHVAYLRPW